jgi:hypothetical protein
MSDMTTHTSKAEWTVEFDGYNYNVHYGGTFQFEEEEEIIADLICDKFNRLSVLEYQNSKLREALVKALSYFSDHQTIYREINSLLTNTILDDNN